MGIRNTEHDPAVALYDSVSMIAFGPMFDTGDEAEAFLTYVRTQTSVEPYNIALAELEQYGVEAQELYDKFVEQTAIADFSEFIEVQEELAETSE